MNKFFKLVVATLLFVIGASLASAKNLTVFDGDQVSVYVPFPTDEYNVYNTRGQVIYPAESLASMAGQPINGFTLYINDEGCKMDGGALSISVGEVDVTAFSSTTYFSGLTQVALLQMVQGTYVVDVDFMYPYYYTGMASTRAPTPPCRVASTASSCPRLRSTMATRNSTLCAPIPVKSGLTLSVPARAPIPRST